MRNIIILDIGTQLIKALLLEIDNNKGKSIIKSGTKECISKDLKESIQRAIKILQKKSGIKSKEIFIGTNNDIIGGEAISFCCKRENPHQKVDLSELKYLIQKIQWRALDKIRKEFVSRAEEIKILNGHIVDVKIDDCSVVDPLNSEGENICLTIFNSYAFARWISFFEKLVSEMDLNLMGLIPNACALSHYLNSEKIKESFLIIDIGSKITELTLVKNSGENIETKRFHLGVQSFNNAISKYLSIDENGSEIIRKKYIKEELGKETKKKLDKIFEPSALLWFNGAKIALGDFLKEYKALPTKIYLCGEGGDLTFLQNKLKQGQRFKLKNLLLENVRTENCSEIKDVPSLALAEFCLHCLRKDDVFSLTLRRVIRLIQS